MDVGSTKNNSNVDLTKVNDDLYKTLTSNWIYNNACEYRSFSFGVNIEPISRDIFILGEVQALIQLFFEFRYTDSEQSRRRKQFCEDLCFITKGMDYEQCKIGDEYLTFRYVFYSDIDLSELKRHINFMKVKYGNSVNLSGHVDFEFVIYREGFPEKALEILQCS